MIQSGNVIDSPERSSGTDTSRRRWRETASVDREVAHLGGLLAWLGSHDANPERGFAMELGCGAGRMSRALAGAFEFVWGFDREPSLIERARELNAGRTRLAFRVSKFMSPPKSLFEMDFVLVSGSLEYLPHSQLVRLLGDVMARLSPHGAAVIEQSAADSAFVERLSTALSYAGLVSGLRVAEERATFGACGNPVARFALIKDGAARS